MSVPHSEPHGGVNTEPRSGNYEPHLRVYAAQATVWGGLGQPRAADNTNQPGQSSPVSEQTEQNRDPLEWLPRCTYFGNDDALDIEDVPSIGESSQSTVVVNVHGDDGRDHQKQTFRFDKSCIPRTLPLVFEHSGVTQDTFTADMRKLQQLHKAWHHAKTVEMMVCGLTFGLMVIYMYLNELQENDIDTRYQKRLGVIVAEMNTRYRPRGIVWSVKFNSLNPFSGTYVSYESS
jgi:hypothetical protein